MQQTLFRIPLHGPWSLGPFGEVPGFGFGLVLCAWLGFGLWALLLRVRKTGFRAELAGPVLVWLVVAGVIAMLPRWVQRGFDSQIAELTSLINQAPGAERGAALARAHVARGDAFAEKLDFIRAGDDYRAAIALDPTFPDGHRQLAWLRASCPVTDVRDAQEALHHARRACELTSFQQASVVDTLAVSCAEAGQYDEAVAWEQQAAGLASSSLDLQERVRLAEIRKRLGAFQKGQPYRHRFGNSVPIFGYGSMLFLGFLCAGWLASRRAVREGLGDQLVWDLALWLFLAGIVGARLFYLIQKPDHVFESARTVGDYVLAAINLREGGLVFYGSVLGGIAAYLVFCRRRKIDALYLADVVVPPIFVGVAFGRLGCLLNGCCFGDVCSLPWKITFPLGSVPDMSLVQQGLLFPDSLSSLPLHPTQIYSSLDAVILACLTAAYFPRRAFNGAVTVLALTTYAVTRFAIEILRGDEAGQFGTALTIAQWLSIGVFIYAIGLGLWCWHRRGRKACPDSLPDQDD